MHLCNIPTNKIHTVEIPTGLPLVYDSRLGCLRLLEDDSLAQSGPGQGQGQQLLAKYNFGTNPELLFQRSKRREMAGTRAGEGEREGMEVIDMEKMVIRLHRPK
jgi:hypothetical protein